MLLSIVTSGGQVDLLLIAISFIILIGYVSEIIFRITKVPEVLILMFIGIVLGPASGLLPTTYIATLRGLTPLFGSIALIMIMFNGGRIIKLQRRTLADGTGYLLALADTVIPGIAIAALMFFVFKWPLIYGGLLGVILGETSAIMVLPLIKKVKLDQKLYDILAIETTFNSVFAILIFYLLLAPISGTTFSVLSYIQYSISYIAIGVVMGLAAGIGWLLVQNIFKGARGYIATLAIAILLYSVVDYISGSAVVSVLIYAMIIGNSKIINKYLGFRRPEESKYATDVEREMEFLVRTFFFVLLGIISFISVYYFLFALVITAVLIVVRKIEIGGLLRMESKVKDLVFSLMPRGLGVAVLSSIYYATGFPYSQEIFYLSFMTIILTNVAFSLATSRTIKRF
ncbi:MAG TPA: cation:proton antiporter [Candidatus Saccharimonadales bacterium]|nr:cation:proton antiporter [Candidatus Saccharimonadales bacterium]